MVTGIDKSPGPQGPIQAAARLQIHMMGGIASRRSLRMADGTLGIFTGQILIHIASQGNIDQLAAPADSENRFAGLIKSTEQCQFEQIPFIVGPTDFPNWFLSE